ncbi:Thiouridylase, cytoplasmic, subunit 2 [Moelleriella libera RCEF 2490]|uniref:Thiouridylase, cytoplasmic, subunit 2 n=1 Tax=Moelleriella libera RCEF 2490 TaxID=1081109 RepID=A0A166PVB4_9HYPO|nr:Thiouridylase, cytoplasmic, subunit 2 [Moelleriella libera RCEF 2490]
MPVYYPLREVFKNEIMTYLDLVPTVKDLMPEDGSNSGNIVSHKDMSISDVVERYFESVEGAYSGIVANVVRTTGKLDGVVSGEFCRLCGMTLDGPGDSRWAGELGDEIDEFEVDHEVHLCYGCRRTIRG